MTKEDSSVSDSGDTSAEVRSAFEIRPASMTASRAAHLSSHRPPHPAGTRPAAPPPSRSLSASAGGMSFAAAPVVPYSPYSPSPVLLWARVGVACAERAEGRSAGQPGLMK